MNAIGRGHKVFLILGALSGCAGPENLATRTFFLCGCDQCAAFVKATDPALIDAGEVVFRGGPGDAEEFRTRFHLATRVVSDFDGRLFAANGIQTCPSAIVTNDRERVVLGNGARLDASAIRGAGEKLSR